VPVAVNLYKIREQKSVSGELYRRIQQQKPQYQGLWVVGRNLNVLSAHHEMKSHATWTAEVLEMLEQGCRAFGTIAPRRPTDADPLPHRGVGALSDGSVQVALYTRYVRGGGKDAAPKSVNPNSLWLWDGEVKPDGPVVIDSIELSTDEWKLFSPVVSIQNGGTVGSRDTRAPSGIGAGQEWTLPEAIARKFVRALSPSSDQSTMPKPDEAVVAELKARVESVEGGRVSLRLTGRWETKHIYDGKPSYAWTTGTGLLICEGGRAEPKSLLMTIAGAYRMAPPYDTGDRPIAAVVEWRR
jgi:hypothetical protein